MVEDKFKVNFLIAGTQKGGTSALASFLSQHPEICMPSIRKEPHFFDDHKFDEIRSIIEMEKAYQTWYPNYNEEPLIGDPTPIYMYLPWVAERIYRYNPKIKIIILLRDPVARAFSHYYMDFNRELETWSIWPAFIFEPLRRYWSIYGTDKPGQQYSYLARGRYYKQIKNLLKYFPIEQMLFIKSSELLENHDVIVTKVYEFLGVSDRGFIAKPKKIFTGNYPSKSRKYLRKFLLLYFKKDIKKLEKLLSWELDEWKK